MWKKSCFTYNLAETIFTHKQKLYNINGCSVVGVVVRICKVDDDGVAMLTMIRSLASTTRFYLFNFHSY